MRKSNNGIIIVLSLCIIVLLVLCTLFATNTISLNNAPKEEDNENETVYEASDYITLEDVTFNSKVSTKKVKLNHLSDDLTKQFYEDQNDVINAINVSDSDVFNAEYDLKYFINDNILSVLYTIDETDEIGTCAKRKAVTNIDLINKKVISEEELLKRANTSYADIVDKYYEEQLESWKQLNERNGQEISYYEVTFADFRDNKEKFVSDGIKKIPDIIYTYIEDGKIKYDYYAINVSSLFHSVGKGGCFNWKTVDLGEY